MTNTKTSKRYCILLTHTNGRTYYHSTVPGTMTCRTANVWSTADRDAAIMLAATMGGSVVPVVVS